MSKTIGSKEYNEWLNNPLTKALKRSFEQSITDPENQPSQYGTVTLSMYERLEEQLTTAQAQIKVLREALEHTHNALKRFWPDGHLSAIEALAAAKQWKEQ